MFSQQPDIPLPCSRHHPVSWWGRRDKAQDRALPLSLRFLHKTARLRGPAPPLEIAFLYVTRVRRVAAGALARDILRKLTVFDFNGYTYM